MRMAKLRRKYERQLEGARDVWRADQATIRAAGAERAETAKKVRSIRDTHTSMLVRDPYGRGNAKRAVCSFCTTRAFPCPTWKSLDGLLERLQGRPTR